MDASQAIEQIEVFRMDWIVQYLAVWGVWVLLFLALVVGLALWMNSTPWD